MTISGKTLCFAVLGRPVRHSLSPLMHNLAFAQLGLDAVYVPFDVGEADLSRVLPALEAMGFGGINLTIPLKQRAFTLLARHDDSARRLGAVNTIAFDGDGPIGFNTDGEGFLRDLSDRCRLDPRDRHVLILGCGGAGRAIAITCAIHEAKRLVLYNRTPARAIALRDDIRQIAPDCPVAIVPETSNALIQAARHADLIVQCSASGMHPDDPPLLPPQAFRPGQTLYDLVYVRPSTPIMQSAEQSGALAVNGLGMLLHQGIAAFKIWTGREPDAAAMRHALECALYSPPSPATDRNLS